METVVRLNSRQQIIVTPTFKAYRDGVPDLKKNTTLEENIIVILHITIMRHPTFYHET